MFARSRYIHVAVPILKSRGFKQTGLCKVIPKKENKARDRARKYNRFGVLTNKMKAYYTAMSTVRSGMAIWGHSQLF